MSLDETLEAKFREIQREENKKMLESIRLMLEEHMAPQGDKLLNPNEAAEILGYAPSTVYELCRQDAFPTVRDGRKVRISYIGLQQWIKEKSQNQLAN
ncbi:helix-turn-helix domain-containing protein [Terribacillus sp. 7520-G]|uniref:helix-turn-helix domain-containing protein n=1 Tax=Terribacillus TaxID=459532 RepID=UPI000BA76B08|nr:helix-turn-helix domain-containing protein [Terribacillus sp. 7520-G]PAD38644.1 hypothetical protein CHH53_10470 [Terribacillus sp. 7520-G]